MSNKNKRLSYWSELNVLWESSALAQHKFCEQQGVAYKQFVYWRGKVSNKNKSKQSEPTPKLLKVSTSPPKAEGLILPIESPSTLEVITPTGIKIYINTDADVKKASALIKQLGGAL